MRRSQSILSLAFAASLMSGCLGSVGSSGEPQTSAPSTGSSDNGATGGAGSGGGSGSSSGGAAAGGSSGTTSGGGSAGGGTVSQPPIDAGPPATSGNIAITLDKASDTIRLNESKSYVATITPADGFSGSVTLALDNPPAGVSATFNPSAIMVSGTTPATVAVTVTVASDMTTPATSVTLAVKGTSGSISGAASLGVMVPAELLVQIPKGVNIGTDAAPNKQAFGTYGMPVLQIAPGTKVTWVNNDTIDHEVHSDGSLGIQHEQGTLKANGANTYTQTFAKSGTFTYRCHIHPNMEAQIVVNDPKPPTP